LYSLVLHSYFLVLPCNPFYSHRTPLYFTRTSLYSLVLPSYSHRTPCTPLVLQKFLEVDEVSLFPPCIR
jgi:hypothetical protein